MRSKLSRLVGGEDTPANAALLFVPLAGIGGARLSGLRPRGMALTLTLMAGIQAGITALALAFGWKPLRHGPVDILGPNALFILLYLASALLFWDASDRTPSPAARALRAALLLLIGGAVGAAGIYVGATDDAPGASLLGAVAIVGATELARMLCRRNPG
jgi:hypothetical protein